MAIDPTSQNAFGNLATYLQGLGLGDLFTVSSDGTPSGWLWDQVTKGIDTPQTIVPALEATPQFQQRFPVIKQLREQAAQGRNVIVPTVGNVIDYETTAAQLMKRAGLPAWFYDDNIKTQELMAKGIAPTELQDRIGKGWALVHDADPSVRQAFSDFYGVTEGDNALAAFMLDPDHALNQVEKASRAAYTAGQGKQAGLDISKDYAERIAALPKTEAGINSDLAQVSAMKGLTKEGLTETNDITTNDAIDAVAFGNGDKGAAFQDRAESRRLSDRGSGGAAVTQAGAIGLRNAK